MNTKLQEVIDALQAHLQSADLIEFNSEESYRGPVPPITCRDGVQFSIQAGNGLYCEPRSNQGPWSAVEVMTLTQNTEPRNWSNDAGDGLAGYVPIEAVAQEILERGHLLLTDD